MFPLQYKHPRIINSARELVLAEKTPIHLYDEKTLRETAEVFTSLPSPFGLTTRYAIKANSQKNIIVLFDKLGIHFDASSEYEAIRLLNLGIAGEKILLTSQQAPKNIDHLLKNNVRLNACSLLQTEQYSLALKQFSKSLSIRINPGTLHDTDFKRNVSGKRSSFGIWKDYVEQAFGIAKKNDVTVEALHVHIGSGVNEASWLSAMESLLIYAKKYKSIHRLNLGGGFFIDRVGNRDTDIKKVIDHVSKSLNDFYLETNRKIHMELEPGSYLVTKMGHLVTQIEDIVSTGENGFRFIKLDMGMNDYIRPALYHSQHLITHIAKDAPPSICASQNTSRGYVLVGHCCENGDLLSPPLDKSSSEKKAPPDNLFSFYPLENPKPGDILILHGTGAYGSTMSSHYNSFPFSSEYWLDMDGRLHIVRKRQKIEEIYQNEVLLNGH